MDELILIEIIEENKKASEVSIENLEAQLPELLNILTRQADKDND